MPEGGGQASAPVLAESDDAARALALLLRGDRARFDDVARELARRDRTVAIPIVGHSMEPALADGFVATVTMTDGAACAAGDVVVFRDGDAVIAHRVIHRGTGHLVTCGDSRLAPDPPVAFSHVLGRIDGAPAAGAARAPLLHTVVIAALALHPSVAGVCARLLRFVERRSRRWAGALKRRLG